MSSDSEDDFYGNITERLQKEKEKFQEDKTEIASLLDDTGELDEIVKNNKLPPKNKRKSAKRCSEETTGSSTSDLPDVSVDSTVQQTSKRVTRSRAKKTNTEVVADLELPPTRSKRQKKSSTTNDSTNTGECSSPRTSKGRGSIGRGRGGTPRGRGRRGRGRVNRRDIIAQFLEAVMGPPRNNPWDPSIPTYSVGNTAEYPDQSYNQPLFSNSNKPKTDEDVVTIEEETLDEDNEELSVKIYWQSSEFFKFTIRRYQKLTQIFEYFSKKENVTRDKLLFTYNEKILKPDDTPDKIQYSIVKFIDGGIITQGVTDLIRTDCDEIKGGIKIKFQCQNTKKPFEISIRPDDKLSTAMMRCSEHLEKPLNKLKFEFDGDGISGKSTARDLEFEGGECIDVRIIS